MTCKETMGLLCWHLEGKLSLPAAVGVRQHLDTCKDCRMVLEAAQRTLQIHFDSEVEPALTDKVQLV
jgi:predicted anti-sigma-YlaC factor YlaD